MTASTNRRLSAAVPPTWPSRPGSLVPLVVAHALRVHASASRLPTPHESETKLFGNPGNDDLVLRRFGFSTGRGRRDSTQLTTLPSRTRRIGVSLPSNHRLTSIGGRRLSSGEPTTIR